MPIYTVLTRKQARAATKAHTAYRKALRAEARAAKVDAPTPIMWRLAAACDRTLQAFWRAMQGLAAPVKRTAKNRALGGVLALATIGRVIARAARKVASAAARKAARAAARVARKTVRAARAALRRAVVGVLALLPLTATATTTTTTTEPVAMSNITAVSARVRSIAVTTATNVYDDATRLFRDNPSAAAYTAQELAALALQAARHLVIGDQEDELDVVNIAIERAARSLRLLRETREQIAAPITPPAMLNGYPVRDAIPRDPSNGGGYVVLVERDGFAHPWVTAVWLPASGTTWEWGNYFHDEGRARRDLRTR
jgi:hypothetical protein